MKQLTYEEWCAKYMINVTADVVNELSALHNINAHAEIKLVREHEYNKYLLSNKDV